MTYDQESRTGCKSTRGIWAQLGGVGGDLEGDLKDKKFSAWQEGITLDRAEKPKSEEIERDGWILGGDNAELTFDDQGRYAEIQFVEQSMLMNGCPKP